MLYGRDQQVIDLLRVQSPVTVISGDGGVGKTWLLEEIVGRFDGVAPAPVVVGHAPAALQAGLLEALGAAAALIVQDEGAARRVGKLLVEGGRRLARVKANEIGLAVARLVLGAVRDRVGDNVAEVLNEYVAQVRNAATDDLVSRVRQAADPDVIHAIAGLAADVAAAAGGRRLLLSLDNVNHLQPDDRARLMDLGPILPAGISVICTFTSFRGADESILDQYRLAGISAYPLYGLEPWAVRQWLDAEGLAADLSERVWRKTNGYGLAVDAAVRLLKAGKHLAEATEGGRDEVIRAATREALRELDTDSRTAAVKLSVLAAPLPAPHVAEYLEMDSATWAVTEGLLIDSHIFVPGNPPWFHDQRRLLLRQQIPDSTVVPYLQAAGAQLSALAQAAEVPADTLIQYADISDSLVSLGAADPTVSAVAQLDDDALAVLGAVIELTDGSSPGVDGEQALLYARRTFRTSGDLLAALREVSAAGLAITASNQNQTVVAANFGSVEAWLYANGRIGTRLGRMPLPRIASLVFYARLSDPLGSFASVVYGVGDPPLGELAKRSIQLQVRPPHVEQVRPGRKGPSLLLNGLFGDTPFFAAVAYENPQHRDAALSQVRALPAEPVFGRPVELTSVATQPDAPLPARRLVRAFERALGFPIGNAINSFDVTVQGEKISGQDAVGQKLGALNLLAEMSNEREGQVTGHSASQYGLLWWVAPHGDAELTAVVANGRGIIPLGKVPVSVIQRFDRAALAQLAGLHPHQVIGLTQIRAERQSQVTNMQPVIDEIVRHSRKIVAYNQHQPRRQVAADPDSLQALIQEQLDEREVMARTITDFFGRTLPVGRDVYLLIDPHVRDPGMIPGAGQGATIIEAPMHGSSPRALVAIEPPWDTATPQSAQHWQDSMVARWKQVFAVPDVAFTAAAEMSMLDAVTKLLGHMFNEVWLVETGPAAAAHH